MAGYLDAAFTFPRASNCINYYRNIVFKYIATEYKRRLGRHNNSPDSVYWNN